MEPTQIRKIKSAFFLSILFLVLIRTGYYWQKLAGFVFPIVGTLIAVLFITISIRFVISIVTIIKQRKNLSQIFIPTIVYVYAIADGLFNPFNVDVEKLQSKVLMRACYEGTMNTATLKFREDRTFELQWVGWFGISDFYEGIWKSEGDTLFLSFERSKPLRIGEILVIENDKLITIKKENDGLENVVDFIWDIARD